MAYRAFDEWPLAPIADASTNDVELATDQLPFTPLELRVIVLSETERVSSVEPPSRIGVFLATLFGIRRPTSLADPRLEALRRFAILARAAGDRIADSEVNKFLQSGFDHMQAAWLRRNVRTLFAR